MPHHRQSCSEGLTMATSPTTPFARVVYHYPGFIDAIRERTVDLEISRFEIDRIAGLPIGYSGKLLSLNPVKRVGFHSLGPLLETLGLIIMIVENPAARDRTLARRDPVCVSNQRFGNKCNSPLKIESIKSRAKLAAPRRENKPPPVSRAHLRVVQNKRGGKYGRL
jgi:hypothetical protein